MFNFLIAGLIAIFAFILGWVIFFLSCFHFPPFFPAGIMVDGIDLRGAIVGILLGIPFLAYLVYLGLSHVGVR